MSAAQQTERDEIAHAYAICKAQASVDGAFDEILLQHWFEAAWDICASMVDLTPEQDIIEPICIRDDGSFTLRYRPTSEVKIYDGYTLVTTLPRSLIRDRCQPPLCCLCHPKAHYRIGNFSCQLPPRFIQAVARVFAFICENRGDTQLDPATLGKCGALTFLMPDLTFVA